MNGMTKEQMAERIANELCGPDGSYQGLPRATVVYMYTQLTKEELIRVYARVVLNLEAL